MVNKGTFENWGWRSLCTGSGGAAGEVSVPAFHLPGRRARLEKDEGQEEGRWQGSTKWFKSWLSEITEILFSHRNFSLEITYKIPKTGYFGHKKVSVSQKQVNVTQKRSVTETSLLHRNKFQVLDLGLVSL